MLNATVSAPTASLHTEQDPSAEAEYQLETPVTCPACSESVSSLHVIRMLRTRVNFTSTLPRRGRAIVCPSCSTLISAELGALS